MSKAMYGKTMMKSGGTKKLVKKGMGGPGSGMGDKYGMTPYKNKNGGATKTTYKTGGMVNANAKITASKVAKGRPVKSTAPKKALPKAKLGMSMKSKKSC